MHSCFAAAHLHGVTKPTLCFPGSGFARWERAVLTMAAFAGAGGGQQAPQCVVQGSSHVPHLGMILGGRVMVVAGLGPRGESKNGFLIFFGFSAQALTVGTADETPRQKPCPRTMPSWSRAVPRTLCLKPLPVWSGVSSASSFAAAVPHLLSLSPRSDLFQASEMLLAMETQKRFPGEVSWQGGCVLLWSPEGWPLRVHAPVPALPTPAGNHQLCRVGRQCPTANTLHQLGEPGPSLGRGVSPAPQIQVGKNPLVVISSLCSSPGGGFTSLGAPGGPTIPSPLPMAALVSPMAAPQL